MKILFVITVLFTLFNIGCINSGSYDSKIIVASEGEVFETFHNGSMLLQKVEPHQIKIIDPELKTQKGLVIPFPAKIPNSIGAISLGNNEWIELLSTQEKKAKIELSASSSAFDW